MTITNYSELQAAIARRLKRADLGVYIPDYIRAGELRIYRELRVRAMEASLNATISSGVIAVPSGYAELKFAYVNGSPIGKLTRKAADWIYQNYPNRSANGQPKFIAREADSFIFGPYPDDGYTIKGVYYKRLDALSDTNTSNWFTTNAPDLLLYAALCEAMTDIQKDERLPIWEGKYGDAKTAIELEDKREEFSGSPLFVTSR